MKQIDYTMRIKRTDNNQVWNEDNSAVVRNDMTIGEHAQQTVDRYNKTNKKKIFVFVLARQLPKRYITKLQITE